MFGIDDVKHIKQMTMNTEITLEINGYKRNILRYGYQFFRNTDRKGRPVTGLLGGNIYVEMESDESSDVLEMMLADMNKPRPCFFFRPEPVPVWGKIRHTVDDMMFRELAFDEAYIYYYGETMDATGANPMLTRFLISPTRLDINRTVRMDRRISTTYGFWWEEYKEEEKIPIIPAAISETSKPIVLVTSVKGNTIALPNDKVRYKVTGYSLPTVNESDCKRVKWVILVDGIKEYRKEQGEIFDLQIKEEWAGKEITVMPYLRAETINVSVKTQVRTEAIVVFVNGYWNTGKTESLAEPLKKMIAKNIIGTKSKRGYWGSAFINNAYIFFMQKYKQWTNKTIPRNGITPLFIDGSNVWNSSGQTRFNAGWNEAEELLKTDLLTHNVINNEGLQKKRIFIVSHSMGGAHAEGMISAWKYHNLEIEYVLHFSAADNKDFQVKLPHITYQINLVPDPVLMYKNADDSAKVLWENFWNMLKRPYLDTPNVYMIEKMLPEHYIEVRNADALNHAHTKGGTVWNLVPFLKN